jgi:hypothetical protein
VILMKVASIVHHKIGGKTTFVVKTNPSELTLNLSELSTCLRKAGYFEIVQI